MERIQDELEDGYMSEVWNMNAKYYNFMNGLFSSFPLKDTSSTLQVLTK